MLAIQKAPAIGFARYIISASTPFSRDDLPELRANCPAVVRRHVPAFEAEYQRRRWSMAPGIDRVYINELARRQLGWRPQYDFHSVLRRLSNAEDFRSGLARDVGSKGYHDKIYFAGPYPLSAT